MAISAEHSLTRALLQPALALVMWTHAMWLWMYITRIPAVRRMQMRLDPFAARGTQMATLPAHVRWKADNYNHLFEQPTIFYATVLSLALLASFSSQSPLPVSNAWLVGLAWAYVAFRVVHSFHQALWNKIEIRFALFFLSSLVLITLSALALMWVFA
jgi:hypothetical protein